MSERLMTALVALSDFMQARDLDPYKWREVRLVMRKVDLGDFQMIRVEIRDPETDQVLLVIDASDVGPGPRRPN